MRWEDEGWILVAELIFLGTGCNIIVFVQTVIVPFDHIKCAAFFY